MFSGAFIEHFHFLRPWWALVLIPLGFSVYLQWSRRDATRGWQSVIAPHLLEALRVRQFRNHWFNPITLTWVVMTLMTITLMGPSWRQQASPLTRDEAALVILLDVSASMRQNDIQPSRIQRAKQKLSDLLALRQGSRTALVAFAGSAHTVLNLTDDSTVLGQYTAAVNTSIMPRDGKFPEYALPLIDRISTDPSLPTTVLLITDGVSDASEQAFSDYFANRPHQLLVWGVGLQEPAADSGIAALDGAALQSLAGASDGRYIDLTVDKSDIGKIHRRINSHYVVTADSAVPWLDSGYWLVFPSLLAFSLWFRKGWTLQWALAGILATSVTVPQTAHAGEHWFADLWLTPDQQGRWLLQQGEYLEAASRFSHPLWKGTAYYYAEEFKLAAEYFSRVDSETALFNRANALAHGQDYLLAVRVYDQLIRRNPEHPLAQRNRDIVQEIIDAINLMSESQREEPGDSAASRELGDDDPQRADGAEKTVFETGELEQFSAEQILQDPAVNEMWLRGVQRDPSQFLGIKFSMQLEQSAEQPAEAQP